jgi:hypothetical protein
MRTMPRYLIERALGDVTREEIDAIATRSTEIREARYPQITWEHTQIVRGPDGVRAFCVYAAPDPDLIKAHAAELGAPLEQFHEIWVELTP